MSGPAPSESHAAGGKATQERPVLAAHPWRHGHLEEARRQRQSHRGHQRRVRRRRALQVDGKCYTKTQDLTLFFYKHVTVICTPLYGSPCSFCC